MTLANEITMVEGQGTGQPYVFYMAAQPSLCIPAMGLEDGPLGVGDGLTGVTQLPSGASLAATFDTSLARRYGAVIGQEEWGKGAAVNLGPTVNILRDPRWGRSFEAFTEDPFLNAALAVSEIGGVQAQGEMSQVKHFAAYNQETNRNTPADNVIVSNRTLHEIYLPAFQQAVTQGQGGLGDVRLLGDQRQLRLPEPVPGDPGPPAALGLPRLRDLRLRRPAQHPGGGRRHRHGAAVQHVLRPGAAGRRGERHDPQVGGGHHGQPDRHRDVPLRDLQPPADRDHQRHRHHPRPPGGGGARVAEDGTVLLKNDGGVLPLPAAHAGTVAVIGPAASAAPTPTGGGSAFVTAPFSVTPLQGLQAAAGPGTSVVYQQGLPTDTSLPAIPASVLSPAYAPTPLGGSYTGTLTAPETGTYVLAITNPCGCYNATTLSLDGTEILSDPSTPPVHTFSVAVQLQAGHTYQIQISGNSSALTWATPSALAPGISQAAAAARSASTAVVVVSDDTETEAADRPGLGLPSAQDELISAVAAANPHTVVVIDAGAPVTMPWLGQVAAVVDAWYPGESNGTALASVLYGATDPSGHLPVTFPRSLSQVPASTPAQFPGVGGQVQYSEGIDVGYRWYDAQNLTPLFPFGYGLSYTSFAFSDLRVTPSQLAGRGALVHVTARVTNTGPVTGAEVAQLYLGDPATAGEPPRQLKGFQQGHPRAGPVNRGELHPRRPRPVLLE